jgi:hypothetical protein
MLPSAPAHESPTACRRRGRTCRVESAPLWKLGRRQVRHHRVLPDGKARTMRRPCAHRLSIRPWLLCNPLEQVTRQRVCRHDSSLEQTRPDAAGLREDRNLEDGPDRATGASLRSAAAELPCAPSTLSDRITHAEAAEVKQWKLQESISVAGRGAHAAAKMRSTSTGPRAPLPGSAGCAAPQSLRLISHKAPVRVTEIRE